MQTIIYVLAKSSKQRSLRELVISDLNKWNFDGGWEVVSQQTKGRPKGWAKIRRKNTSGALNIEWDGDAKTLIGRAVSRKGNDASQLVGDFVGFLLRWHGKRISSITMRTI